MLLTELQETNRRKNVRHAVSRERVLVILFTRIRDAAHRIRNFLFELRHLLLYHLCYDVYPLRFGFR